MRLGLAGPGLSGKSTILRAAAALAGRSTGAQQTAAGSGSGGAGPAGTLTLATVPIPDPRVDWLAEKFHPRKVTYATLEMAEVGALVPAQMEAIHRLDAVAFVVRAFDPEQAHVPHPAGRVDPAADFQSLWQDWILLDWTLFTNRIDRLRGAPSVPKGQRRDVEREVQLLERCRAQLEAGIALRQVELSPEEQELLRGFSPATMRPTLLVVNVDESQAASGTFPGQEALARACRDGRCSELVTVSARLEAELAELDRASRESFMQEMGMAPPLGVERLARAAYDACHLISFLTAGDDEVKAWTVPQGTAARDAAGKIHTDIARGFIRAEVVPFTELKRLGSHARAREAGALRLEGKTYEVQDGDVIEFRFNV